MENLKKFLIGKGRETAYMEYALHHRYPVIMSRNALKQWISYLVGLKDCSYIPQ